MKLISIWGKGGVGKSTIASLIAYHLAKLNNKVLLITTDFVPTISQIFGTGRSREGVVSGLGNLKILEISPEQVIEMWKERFGEEVYSVISSIFPINRDIIDYIAGAPGLADEFMLYVIYEKWRKNEADYIIWDLPAAGDALRLLRLEKQFYDHLGDAVKMYLRIKSIIRKISKRASNSPLQLIESWRELAVRILNMLSDKNHNAYLVATPDKLSVEVSKRILTDLKMFRIPIKLLIINMVYPGNLGSKIPVKAKIQERMISEFKALAKKEGIRLVEIPLIDKDLSSLEGLVDAYNVLRDKINEIMQYAEHEKIFPAYE